MLRLRDRLYKLMSQCTGKTTDQIIAISTATNGSLPKKPWNMDARIVCWNVRPRG